MLHGQDGNAPSIETLVADARATFASQLGKINRLPYAEVERAILLAAFNNAISELVIELGIATKALADTADDNRRARDDLAAVQALGKRQAFSASDPVCRRCVALAATVGNALDHTPADDDGDVCSRCGAVVCVRREDESRADFTARVRETKS